MAQSVNKAIIVGNLGKDPEIRTTGSGTRIANLTVATSERWKDRNSGEPQERTEWHRVAVFVDGVSEFLEKFAKKGDRVYVEGQLCTRKWTDNDGQDRYTTEIHVKPFNGQVVLMNAKQDDGARSGGGGGGQRWDESGQGAGRGGATRTAAQAARVGPARKGDPFADGNFDDDSIPF